MIPNRTRVRLDPARSTPVGFTLRRVRTALATLGTIALLAACTILPRPEPVDVFLLPSATPAPTAAADIQALPWSLRVTRPVAGVHLAGQRIVVIPRDNQVSVYKGANWSEPAPILVRNRLLDAFRADARIDALSSDEKRVHADFELDSDLRAFHSEYRDGAPEVVVRLDARLVHAAGQRIVASRSFEIREAVAGTSVPEVVQAFGHAGDRLAQALVAWTVERANVVQGR
ncbi:MAG: ABC transporter [Betaproteobacteria bacterium HGW-Betaproteobacteria-21]|nr:MAG: ABC transporter [Betaproteobacteria bacterium HGW-Betaproteobacteria-21]